MAVDDATALALTGLTGLAVSTAFHFLVLPLLPSSVRERVSLWAMRLRKYVLSPSVDVELVAKAPACEEGVPAGDVLGRVEGGMRSAGLDAAAGGLSVRAPVRVGRQTLSLSVRIVPGDDGVAFGQAEVVVGARCGYRDFEGCIAEMREAQAKAAGALSAAGLEMDRTFCVVCRLKSPPRAGAVLGSAGLDMLSCSSPDGTRFDLYGDKIEYYDTEVHRGMMSFLKGVLVAHT